MKKKKVKKIVKKKVAKKKSTSLPIIGKKKQVTKKPFKKNNKFGTGRKKGSKNKFTTLKEAFYEVFNDLGGANGMMDWALEDPDNMKCFYQMIAKMLPREVALSAGGEGDIESIEVKIVGGKKTKN